MKIFIAFLLILGISANAFCNDFPEKFQTALRLYHKNKMAEAEEIFLKLAAEKVRQYAKDESMEYAAYCAMGRREYDKAEEYAAKIKNGKVRVFCRMNLLQRQRKPDEIIKISEKEQLDSWPDRIVSEAALIRGRAYAALKKGQKAEQDFILSRKTTIDLRQKAYADLSLGTLYRKQMKDDVKAMAAYKAVAELEVLNGAVKYDAVMAYAELLTRQGKTDEAFSKLDKLQVKDIKSAYWKSRIYVAYGDLYAAAGKKSQAIDNYKQAEALKARGMQKIIEQKIASLKK